MPRASRGEHREPLTRERVLRAAVELADEEGLERLSMRHLASRLGVKAMSLYNHVANKDEILDGIVELLVDEIDVPPDDVDWRSGRAFSLAYDPGDDVYDLAKEVNSRYLSTNALNPLAFRAIVPIEIKAGAGEVVKRWTKDFSAKEEYVQHYETETTAEKLTTGAYDGSCPTSVMSVPWSVVTTGTLRPCASRICRAMTALAACGMA